MRDRGSIRQFIRENTAIGHAPMVPEMKLHLASEALPLWEATEQELRDRNLPPPFWAFAWAGGQALARYVLDHPEVVAGRRVLDFASGGGVVALAALQMSAAHVGANEIDPLACEVIAMNADMNGLANGLEVIGRDMLDEATGTGEGPLWDVVFAGDVCYERPMADRVIAWLRRHADAGATVLIGDPGRAYIPKEGVREIAEYTVPTDQDLEDRTSRETKVLQLI